MVSYVVGDFRTRYLLEWYLIEWDLLVWDLKVRDLLSCNREKIAMIGLPQAPNFNSFIIEKKILKFEICIKTSNYCFCSVFLI